MSRLTFAEERDEEVHSDGEKKRDAPDSSIMSSYSLFDTDVYDRSSSPMTKKSKKNSISTPPSEPDVEALDEEEDRDSEDQTADAGSEKDNQEAHKKKKRRQKRKKYESQAPAVSSSAGEVKELSPAVIDTSKVKASRWISSFLKKARSPTVGEVPQFGPLSDTYLRELHLEATRGKGQEGVSEGTLTDSDDEVADGLGGQDKEDREEGIHHQSQPSSWYSLVEL